LRFAPLLVVLVALAACGHDGTPTPTVSIQRRTSAPRDEQAVRTVEPPPIAAVPSMVAVPSVVTAEPAPFPTSAASTATPPPEPHVASVDAREDAGLDAAIRRALGDAAEDASVVVKRLTDGAEARWNPDTVYYAASTYKLEVLYEAFRQREQGELDFAERVPMDGRYLAEDLGTISSVPRGEDGTVVVADAVRAMVTLSDNASATMLLDLLGHRTIDATMAGLGLRDSSVNTTDLPTTATDMALLMESIVRGTGLDARAAADMTALLMDQETRSGIPRGVPAGVPVGNKTGTWEGATHDVAVVFAPAGAYVIAVLTDHSWDWDLITRVSRAVYDYWNQTAR
jgi:beta-lactamase class A